MELLAFCFPERQQIPQTKQRSNPQNDSTFFTVGIQTTRQRSILCIPDNLVGCTPPCFSCIYSDVNLGTASCLLGGLKLGAADSKSESVPGLFHTTCCRNGRTQIMSALWRIQPAGWKKLKPREPLVKYAGFFSLY